VIEPVFRREPLLDVIAYIEHQLAAGARSIAFCALDPDLGRGCYAGELVEYRGEHYVHRPLHTWLDLAERLGLRMLTPRALAGHDGLIALRFERLEPRSHWPGAAPALDSAKSPGPGARPEPGAPPEPGARPEPGAPTGLPAHTASTGSTALTASSDIRERYGPRSDYARASKLEDPGFVIDLSDALGRARLGPRPRVLDLGVNTGDELAVLTRAIPDADLVGIDHSASALVIAQDRYPAFGFIAADLAALATLGLGTFDLVISLNTLQSPGVDDREVLRTVVQHHLAPGGAVILGLPNSRYVDGELVYGARMKNFRQPELGLLIKDVAFYRKYLQQHGRQVFVTGKHHLLITGVANAAPPSLV
jgi:SAM-dependent methyltransferase